MQTYWSEIVAHGRRISSTALDDIKSLTQWQSAREARRREFLEMVGLGTLPARCELAAQLHGTVKGPGYRIERISLQSLPDVHVVTNLYIPDNVSGPTPTVLYLCGHAHSGVVRYQPHGHIWARRGYVCFIVNTLEQGDCVEAGGDHHGLWSERRFDWISRGYAASGGELWNSIRALDYLLTRAEVDPARVGVTGNSGGGSLSWWLPIADDRVCASAPFCGISNIASFVGERTLNNHCDCVLYHNIFERDIPDVGAVIAPRPLHVGAARGDALFHPDSWRQLVKQLRKIYAFYGAEDKLHLCEYDGNHGYSAIGHESVQKWFDTHVAGDKRPILQPEPPRFKESQLCVLSGAPARSERIGLLPELLSVPGRVPLANSLDELSQTRKRVAKELRRTTFRHFPAKACPLAISEVGSWLQQKIHEFTSEGETRLRLWNYAPWEADKTDLVLAVMRPEDRAEALCEKVHEFHAGPVAILEPRGTGPLSWHPSQNWMFTRAALLVGRTPESMQVWDILRGLQALRQIEKGKSQRVFLYGEGTTAVLALHAALQDEQVAGVLCEAPSYTHAHGPWLLGVMRTLDVPQLAGLLAPRAVGLARAPGRQFHWSVTQYERLDCAEQLVLSHTMPQVASRLLAAANSISQGKKR